MKHVYSLDEIQIENVDTVVTIGVFDGVHRGHQALIRRLVHEAHASDRQAVVLTFFPHPDKVLRGLTGRYYLTSPEERARLLGEMGVDCVVTHPFNDQVRQIRAADFVDQLRQRLRMRSLWVGNDFAMGYRREGNAAFLASQGEQKGFEVQTIDLVAENGGEVITSTAIRDRLLAGDVAQARQWLGRGYTVEGEVVHGEGRGHTIGFPTANLDVWEEQIIPANGVYACRAFLGDEQHNAVTNIGVRPTFAGKSVTVEAYLLDFDRDIYGQRMRLSFEKRLRSEQRFDGIQALVAQLQRDVAAGREFLEQAADDSQQTGHQSSSRGMR